jgi:hypothetical protein
MNTAVWAIDGPIAAAYMSPTGFPSWSASTSSVSHRHELGNRAGGSDHAGGGLRVVAVSKHRGQRDHAQRNHRCGDRPRDRAEDRADDDDRIGEPARNAAEELSRALEEVLGKAGALEDRSHESEERDREQQVVRHDAEHAQRQVGEIVRRKQPYLDADQAEEQTQRHQRERNREADEQERDQAGEHDGGHVFDHRGP